jgi:hypothetical protein
MTEIEERNEKAEAALKQLITCAKAECSECQLVPEPEEYQQCLQVIQTCRDILRESLGLPEEDEEENGEVEDGTETE